jgi:Domain of unknown function (DUF4185)
MSDYVSELAFEVSSVERHAIARCDWIGKVKYLIRGFCGNSGTDQWPMTWASDGDVYGVWGDGKGWNQRGTYYYMGVTRIFGSPPGLAGEDVWGVRGKNRKPRGIIADANGTMYIFYGTSADGWNGSYGMTSTDTGRTWTDTETSVFDVAADGLGVVGIAQFGPGYTNIPSGVDSGYFYIYLSGGEKLLGIDIYLARVPKTQLFNRSAYSYFNGLDASSDPIWSSDWSAKKPVFTDPAGMEYHANVSYNPGIGRFIFAKAHDSSSLGVFEGPALWGPWRAIYYGQFMDSFVKFTYQFPQKWMSDDGHRMWMVWSGHPEYDSVNFIKATLTTSTAPR